MTAACLPETETARLSALRSYGVLDTPPDARFEAIASLAARTAGCPIGAISLLDAERQWFKAHPGLATAALPRRSDFCAEAIRHPAEALVVPDALADPRFAGTALVRAPTGIRFYAGVPLVNPEGHALGTLCVMDRTPRPPLPQRQLVDALKGLAQSATRLLEVHRRELSAEGPLAEVTSRDALLDHVDAAIGRMRARPRGAGFSLMLVELEGLPALAADRGPAQGDQAWREAAEVVCRSVRTRRGDVVARIDGHAFGVLLAGGDGREIPTAGHRVGSALARRFQERDWALGVATRQSRFEEPPADAKAALGQVQRLRPDWATDAPHRTPARPLEPGAVQVPAG